MTEYGADFFFTNGQAKHRRQYGRVGETGVWIGRDETWTQVPITDADPLLDEFRDFAEAVESHATDSPIPMDHGRRVMQIFEATEKSHKTGREVVID